jgi:hypothetical protein
VTHATLTPVPMSYEDGAVLVNEINTIPGFTETSVFEPVRGERHQLPEVCERVVLAVELHERARSFESVSSQPTGIVPARPRS